MQAQASERDSAPTVRPQRRPGLGGKLGLVALGFVLGAGFWHAVGFWSFVTAVTLTGNAPDRGSLTSMVLTSPKANDVAAPSPVRAERPQPTEARAPAAPILSRNEQPTSTVLAPAPTTPQTPAARPDSNQPAPTTTVATPTGEPSLATVRQPTDAPRTAELEPAPPQPETVSAKPRRRQETPAWAAKIITGTFDR